MTGIHGALEEPLHTGSGNLHHSNVVDGVEHLIRREREARWTAGDDVHWLHRRFVFPHRYGDARDQLISEGRTVLLAGEPGSGRRSAALMLLREVDAGGRKFKELSDCPDDPSRQTLGPAFVDPGDRLLLDLSHSREEALLTVLGELSSFRTVVRERHAYLVVVLPGEYRQRVEPGLSRSLVSIDRPQGRPVLRKHLRAENITLSDSALNTAGLSDFLGTAPVRDLAELAQRVLQIRAIEPDSDVSRWLEVAFPAVTARAGGRAAEQVEKVRNGRHRALLLAVAMLRSASVEAVFHAAGAFLESVRHSTDDTPRFERAAFAQELGELPFLVIDGQVSFRELAYDEAVRGCSWGNFPDLRVEFCEWVKLALPSSTLTGEAREELAGCSAEQALRTDQAEALANSIGEQVGPGKDGQLPELLIPGVKALLQGLNDERSGALFRRLVHDWSRDPGLSDYLGRVLAHVCTQVIAQNYPDQALVRLHHRARREPKGERVARRALRELVEADRWLLRRLLGRIVEGHPEYEVDLELFLDLVDPRRLVDPATHYQPLITDAGVRAQLTEVWRAVLSSRPHPAWSAHLRAWLRAAVDTPRSDQLLDVLVGAAGGRLELLGRFHVIARDWAHVDSARTGVTEELARKIDAALDLHPDDFELDLTTEEAFR